MFQEILQSYITHERHCMKEISMVNENCKLLERQCERYKDELQACVGEDKQIESKNTGACPNCKGGNYQVLKKMVI